MFSWPRARSFVVARAASEGDDHACDSSSGGSQGGAEEAAAPVAVRRKCGGFGNRAGDFVRRAALVRRRGAYSAKRSELYRTRACLDVPAGHGSQLFTRCGGQRMMKIRVPAGRGINGLPGFSGEKRPVKSEWRGSFGTGRLVAITGGLSVVAAWLAGVPGDRKIEVSFATAALD